MSPDSSSSQPEKLAERNVHRCSDFAEVALPPLPDIPGMITASEGRYLYWLTSRCHTGAGAVVEVGTWLGRSTAHLAAGLRDAGFDEALHCYDRFRWIASFGAKEALPLKPGDSFQPHFERNVRPLYPKLHVTATALRDISWPGGPIEILFLDAPKRLGDISATLAAFGDALVPDLSLIVLQDYAHFPSFELAAVFDCLSGHIELVHEVLNGCTVAFIVRRRFEFGDAQPVSWNFRLWSSDQARDVWRRVLDPLSPATRERLRPGLAMLLHDLGDVEGACEVVRGLERTKAMEQAWARYASTTLYDRYTPLFKAFGLKRRWRSPYVRTRALLGRALRAARLRS